MITTLKQNQYIVVGTNAAGIHAGGAAAQAYRDFGAIMGCAEGCIGGQSYGIVTLDAEMDKVDIDYLAQQANELHIVAQCNPDKQFLLTPVGTGIAGFSHDEMKRLFADMPENVTLPEEWL